MKKLSELIQTEDLQRLNKTNNLKASIHIAARLFIAYGFFYSSYILIEINFIVSIFFLYIYSINVSFFGYAGIAHELSHKRVFSNKKINHFFYLLFTSITWSNESFFDETHAFHHKNTFHSNDFEAKSEQDWSLIAIILYSLIDFRLMKRKISYVLFNSFGIHPDGKKTVSIKAKNSARRTLIFNISIILILAILSKNILICIYFFLAPFTATIFNKILAKSQHYGLEDKKNSGPLEFSTSIKLPKIIAFLYANMNFHAEHHLAPSIPFYNLPEFHKILLKNGHINSTTLKDLYQESCKK